LIGNRHSNLVVKTRRRAQDWSAVVAPVNSYDRLFQRAFGQAHYAIAAQTFHFVISRRILGAAESRWRSNPILCAAFKRKRPHMAPEGAQSDWNLANRILAPQSRLVARSKVNAHAGFGMLRTIIGSLGEDRRRGPLAKFDSVGFGEEQIRILAQVLREFTIQRSFL
jgi:hypothetical protein